MRESTPLLFLVYLGVTALLVSVLPAQRIWIVNKVGGAGVDFTDIPPAIAAAAPGDTVRVLGNAGVSYNGFTLNKGLNIDAAAGASIVFFGSPMILVTGVPAGQVARIHGLNVQRLPGLQVTSCSGRVILSGLVGLQGGSLPIPGRSAMLVSNSPSVLVVDCSGSAPGGPYADSQAVADVQHSNVVFQRCVFVGTDGNSNSEYPTNAGHGLICELGSNVVCVDCLLSGGNGGDAFENEASCGTKGGSAVVVRNGVNSCVVMGASSLYAGRGGTSLTKCPGATGYVASGIAEIAAEVQTTGLIGDARRVRSLPWLVSPGTATLGAPVTVTLRGAPLTTLLLHIDEQFGFTPLPPLPTPYLGTPGALYVAPFVIGSTGALPFTFTVPYLPQCAGKSYYLHALAVEPGTNALSFTNLGDLYLR